jgi:hypothetical protein
MPKGSKGEKRPADVIGNAVKIARLATGEEDEALTEDGKNAAAVSLGNRGGKARAKKLSPSEKNSKTSCRSSVGPQRIAWLRQRVAASVQELSKNQNQSKFLF